jgi:hypothetical protein
VRVHVTAGEAARVASPCVAEAASRHAGTGLAAPTFMPRYPQDSDIDPGRNQDRDREDDDARLEGDPADPNVEPDRSVTRHAEDAEEAEEAELAEEDILEIADLEDEYEARKGDGPDA